MKNLFILTTFLFSSLTMAALEVKITHPQIEENPETVYELSCEKECAYKISNHKKHEGKVSEKLLKKELKELRALAAKFPKEPVPEQMERGAQSINLNIDGKEYSLHLPPATEWSKEHIEINSKLSDLITRLEFKLDKARAKK